MAWVTGEAAVLLINNPIDECQVHAIFSECGTKVIVHFESGWLKHIPQGSSIFVRDFRVSWKDEQTHVFAFYSKGAKIFVHPHQQRGELRFAELFGGIGGWTNAGKLVHMPISVVVESDLCTATACARSHNMELLTAHDYIEKVLANGTISKTCVLHADLKENDTWVAIALSNAAYGVSSPPCQPWSGAGESRGLHCEDGLVMKTLLNFSSIIKMHVIAIENVPGFPKHPDFHTVIAGAAMDGLTLCCHGTHGCHLILPVQRERWLGIFVSSSVQISCVNGGKAKAMSFAHPIFRDVVTTPSISDADCIHTNMTWSERNDLILDMSMRNKMSDHEMAPHGVRNKMKDNPELSPFECRIINKDQQMNAIMASYGSQHEFDESKLKSKGLQTTLFDAHDGERLFSPWEFLAAMGYPKEIQVSCDPKLAWRMAGNGITVAHAWLALYKVHLILGEVSPMSFPEDVSCAIQVIHENCIKLSTVDTVKSDGFWYLIDHIENVEPDNKRPRIEGPVISPTLEFLVEDRQSLATVKFDQSPAFESVGDQRNNHFLNPVVKGGVVMLTHNQKNWTAMVNCAKQTKICDIVKLVLPHATIDHFKKFLHQSNELQWDDLLTCIPMARIVFEPNMVNIRCFEESLHKEFQLMIDTTWKTKSALAFIAVDLGCNPDVLSLQVSNLPLKDDEFLQEYETVEFQLKFKACLPTYVGSIFNGDKEIDAIALAWDHPDFEIQWNGMRPLMVTQVSADKMKHPVLRSFSTQHAQRCVPARSFVTQWFFNKGNDVNAFSCKKKCIGDVGTYPGP